MTQLLWELGVGSWELSSRERFSTSKFPRAQSRESKAESLTNLNQPELLLPSLLHE